MKYFLDEFILQNVHDRYMIQAGTWKVEYLKRKHALLGRHLKKCFHSGNVLAYAQCFNKRTFSSKTFLLFLIPKCLCLCF